MHGFTRVVSNERGHLLPGVPRSSKNPWGNYVGTWDLPGKLPGPRVFVPTSRQYDAHDKLVREFYKLQPEIDGMAKNGRRNFRIEDAGHGVKKPSKLGSISPSHKEPCKDLEPFITRSPKTPPLDPEKDDYSPEECSIYKTCLEQQEETTKSRGKEPYTVTAGQCSAVVDADPTEKKAICSPIPENLLGDAMKHERPIQIPSPDRADAPALVFADELCKKYVPNMSRMPSGSPSPLTKRSPLPSLMECSRIGGEGIHKPSVPTESTRKHLPASVTPETFFHTAPLAPHSSSFFTTAPNGPEECVRIVPPAPCSPSKTVCPPLHDEMTQPPTESSAEYLTAPMRLATPKQVSVVCNSSTINSL